MVQGRPALLKILAILGPVLLIYWQDLAVVAADALNSEVMNYILVIPFIIAYALYRKRRMLQAVTPLENAKDINNTEVIVGASLLFTAFILYWHGSYTFYPVEYHLISMPIFLAGVILLVYNWQTLRQLIFPLAMLLFLEPLPLQIVNMIGFQMSALSSIAAYNLLRFLGLPVALTIIQTPIITVETTQGTRLPLAIDIACSGLYSITVFVAFAVFVGFITRGPLWKRTILFTIGFPIIYGMNVLRIAIIVWIAHGWGEGAAMLSFHLLGGPVLISIATLLVLILGDKIVKIQFFKLNVKEEPCPLCKDTFAKGESFCPYCGTFRRTQQQKVKLKDVFRIMGVIAITLLIIPIQIPPYVFAQGTVNIDLDTFSPEELKGRILPTIPGWDLEFLYRDTDVEYLKNWDAALVYYYSKQGTYEFKPMVYVLIQIMSIRHTWEGSLYVWPTKEGMPTATMLEEEDIIILGNPQITGRYLEFMRVESTIPEVVVYWFEQAQFTANGIIVSRYVSISLDIFPDDLNKAGLIRGRNDTEGIKSLLIPMARSIGEYWQPLKTWTSINISLIQWTQYLLILTISPCAISITYLHMKRRTVKRQNGELYKRLKPSPEKEVLEALALDSGKGLTTAKAIEAKHHEITTKDIESKSLVEALKEATETDLVEIDIVNSEDEPVLIWKPKF